MGSDTLHQMFDYATSGALKRVGNTDSIVRNRAMPKAIEIPSLDTYQSDLMVWERVLRCIGYQFRNDETQPMAVVRGQYTMLDRAFAPKSGWFENCCRERSAKEPITNNRAITIP
jgi:hypothetical protein